MSSSSTLTVNRSSSTKSSSSVKDVSSRLSRLSRIIDSDSDDDLKSLPKVTNNNNEPIEKDESEPEIVTETLVDDCEEVETNENAEVVGTVVVVQDIALSSIAKSLQRDGDDYMIEMPSNNDAGISIKVQTDCQINPDEHFNWKKAQSVEDKSVFCNFDPVFNDDVVIDGSFTLADIEKQLSNIEIIVRKLNRKKNVLLSKKAEKLAQKKKIQKAVDSKNAIEFGLFDDCLTLTNKGTLKASKVAKKETEIQILVDTSDEDGGNMSNYDSHKSQDDEKKSSKQLDLATTKGNNIAKKGRKKNGPERTKNSFLQQKELLSKDKVNNDEVTLISDDAKTSPEKPEKSRSQLFRHKYDKHRNKRLMPSSDSDVEKNESDEPKAAKKRRRTVNDKQTKKASNRKTFKSSEIVENDIESDEDTAAISTRFSSLHNKSQRKFPKFFEPKCFVRLYSYDLEKLKAGLITKTTKITESLDDIDIEEVILIETTFNIEAEKNRSESPDDFDVLMVPDDGSDSFGPPIENVIHTPGCIEQSMEDYTVIDVNDVNTDDLDILSILEKKNEVVTQFIKQ